MEDDESFIGLGVGNKSQPSSGWLLFLRAGLCGRNSKPRGVTQYSNGSTLIALE
jgi:hypothetical protein